MFDSQYEIIATLQYRNKSLHAQLEAFKSGEKYKQMEEDYKSLLHTEESRIHELEVELSKAHAQTVDVRNKWYEVVCDIEKAHKKELAAKDARIRELEKRISLVEKQRDDALDNATAARREMYEAKTALEEEQGKNLKLTAQLHRDFENSSKPSSQSPNHKKISNSREKTGKNPEASRAIRATVEKDRSLREKPSCCRRLKKWPKILILRRQERPYVNRW